MVIMEGKQYLGASIYSQSDEVSLASKVELK